MQPCPSKSARFLQMIGGGLLLAALSTVGTGCTDRPPSDGGYSPFGTVDTILATDMPRDSILDVLTGMNRVAFDSAFVRLDEYAFTRRVRTEELDTTGATTAYRTLTVRYPPGDGSGTVEQADSSGSFRQGGALSSITPSQRRTSRPGNLAQQSLDDQPAYLAPRTREAYRYALRRDTLFDGTPSYVIEAKARSSGQGADQGIRYARLTLDRQSLELVGLTSARISQILLFHEKSLVTLRLQRGPNDGRGWVPHVTRFRALVDVPFRSARQFRTVSAHYDYERR